MKYVIPSLRVYQYPRVQYSIRIKRPLGRSKRIGEQVGTLSVVPGTVQPADCVVVGYRSASLYDSVGGGLLYRGLLSGVVAAPVRSGVCVVRRWTVGIDMGEATVERAAAANVVQERGPLYRARGHPAPAMRPK